MLATVCCCAPAPVSALTANRAYEMVSPPYKGGYGIGVIKGVEPAGNSVVFGSAGIFAGVSWASEAESSYTAHRTATGWTTTAVSSPPTTSIPFDFATSLQYALASGSLEATKLGEPTVGSEYLLHRLDAPSTPSAWDTESWEVAGSKVLKLLHEEPFQKGLYMGASNDFCHIFFGRAEGALLAEAEGTTAQLYDLMSAPAARCNGDGSPILKLVAVKNTLGSHGEPEAIDGHCAAVPGNASVYVTRQESDFNRFPAHGEEVFFTQGLGPACGLHQLFLRLGGEKTIEVSKPTGESCTAVGEVPCMPGALERPSADFSGASEDGMRVFFTTNASLGGEDGDTSNDMYLATLDCAEDKATCPIASREVAALVQVSHNSTPGKTSGLRGVVRISSDGSRAYFVASGVLSTSPNAQGENAVEGSDNLYVYDVSSASIAFVTRLCSGSALSGEAADHACPSDLDGVLRNDTNLWGGSQEAQSNACVRPSISECSGRRETGRELLFSSYGQLVESDTDNAKDLYVYDAVTGALKRVSVGENGHDANGNRNDEPGGDRADATIPAAGGIKVGESVFQEHELSTRALSEDGSQIVFLSAEPLSAKASNGLPNVYEWDEGAVSMVSNGSSPTFDLNESIVPSGHDILFLTAAPLVSQDTDENVDVYDARLDGGGFPEPPLAPEACYGDPCQGPWSVPTPLVVSGSESQAPGENWPPPKTTIVGKRPKSHAGKSRHRAKHGKAVSGRKATNHKRRRARGKPTAGGRGR
jgi:hypothetical protein